MPLKVVVDTDLGIAPWRQVRDQVVHLITTGALAPGTRLPPIRQLARDLALASGTVARAYRELEEDGWVQTARARGTVVAEAADRPGKADLLRAAADDYARAARELGVDPAVALTAVATALESLQ
ncbi:GntR family transcriptional regulator [Amycolatopsis azurea]|uniref:GntR family transcriptional regulator n=1 Tax=Amycolatopsis azurea DSM 43854 TaxID=1238180 RepID=M2Q389_9PSEU|nr:GntR family transcriptional regulator [Amycolatopsis azurea]EMD26405.1 Transcriptional regulator, GntR family [Amycolatopsis azurea DSM 43854]OOC02364.1 GntR family transcriptional regulator [Amycolatopsis azurea DSM 43854]